MDIKSGGLIFDDAKHYIDHLAPFCALHQIPLLVTDPEIEEACREYYPHLTVIRKSLWDLVLPETIISCYPAIWLKNLFPTIDNHTLYWLPHGHSDKGWKIPSFSVLHKETALIYGKRMEKVMDEQKVCATKLTIGNFRLAYWLQNKGFYDSLMDKKFPSLKNCYLYAPTWNDREENSSFDTIFPLLIKHIPKEINLIVKLHPNMEKSDLLNILRWQEKLASFKNIFFLSNFPPIYPLIDRCDAYIGDMSSIGYDFLYFERPMYFFKKKETFPLHRCGTVITPDTIPKIFEKTDTTNSHIRKTYDNTFARRPKYSI